MVAAYLTHDAQTPTPELRNQGVQHLFHDILKFELESVHLSFRVGSVNKYLVYPIDKGLCIVPAEILGYLCSLAVREYGRD